MDHYNLIILDGNVSTKDDIIKLLEGTKSRTRVVFQKLLNTFHQLKQLGEDNERQSFCDFDPLMMLAERSPEQFFSILVPSRIFEQLQKSKTLAVLDVTKWHNMNDFEYLLGEFMDSFGTLVYETFPLNTQSDESEDKSDFMAENIHHLADNLPPPGSAVVNVYWIVTGDLDPDISSQLSLYGALKRLQVFNRASITVLHDSGQDGKRIMASWRKNMDIKLVNGDSLDGAPDPYRIWSGSLSLCQSEKDRIISNRGFCMSYQKYDSSGTQGFESQGLNGSSVVSSSKNENSLCFSPELYIIKQVDRWELPLHVFVPLKLKLYLDDESISLSRELWERLISKAEKVLFHSLEIKELVPMPSHYESRQLGIENNAVLGCFSCKLLSNADDNKVSREDWVKHVEHLPDGCKTDNFNRHHIRMCLLFADGHGAMDVFPLKLPHHFNGGLLEHLAVVAATNGIDGQTQDVSFHLPDLSATFRENETELQRKKALHFEQCRDIYNGLSFGALPHESFHTKLMETQWQIVSDFRSKFLSSKLPVADLNGENNCNLVSELNMDPKDWPERLLMYRNEPNNSTTNKREKSQPLCDLASILTIKEILKKFLANGRPRKNRLSPLRRKRKEKKDEQNQFNTNLDSIKHMDFQEAIRHRFHGVDYCLDTANSPADDSAISTVQSVVLPNETLSSYVTTHTGKTVNKRRGTKAPGYRSSNRETELQDPNIPLPPAHRALRSTSNQSKIAAKDSRVLKVKESNRSVKRKRETPTGTEKHQKLSKVVKTDDTQRLKETRSQRHKRRLQLVVDMALKQQGVGKDSKLYKQCSARLFGLCKSFLKDLHSSHGLKEEMKRIAESNVAQVVQFEMREHNLRMGKNEMSKVCSL